MLFVFVFGGKKFVEEEVEYMVPYDPSSGIKSKGGISIDEMKKHPSWKYCQMDPSADDYSKCSIDFFS